VINELFDFGRPASVKLAVLVDRGGHELPIQADVCAARVAVPVRPVPGAWHAAMPGCCLVLMWRLVRSCFLSAIPSLIKNGELIHLLSIEGLPKSILTQVLDTAANFVSVSDREVKKCRCCVARACSTSFLKTRPATRTTFEIAATRSVPMSSILDIARSSASKGESLLDTIANLSAMAADLFCGASQRIGCAIPDCATCVTTCARHQTPATGAMRTRPKALLDM